ncbi:unnamed protein product [Cylindrotheca closterium]|uniref:SET domain-containing protein n=1 Tax=Cylindrotheca closterium TaxID=2856 RepID=A0AAD2JMV2_9STRA|nr:unnamed protein product [Cylindrotheca closterium]
MNRSRIRHVHPTRRLQLALLLLLSFNLAVFAFQPNAPRIMTRSNDIQLQMYVDIQESAPRDIGTMDEWATSCGVQRCEGFQLTPTQDVPVLEVGVMTATDLPNGSPVLFVPGGMCLSSQQSLQEIGKLEAAEQRLISAKASEHVPQFYLFLKILIEFEKGDQSPWFPWFNALPRYYANGASMTPFCFDCLPPLASSLAMGERIKFIQFFQALRYVDFLSDNVKSSKDLAKWAFAVVYTRGFPTPDGDFKIAPMADMFDHGSDPEVSLQYDEEGNCVVYSCKDVPAGSPLRLSYGDSTNPTQLFARYGFLDETSEASFCKIMISQPSKELVDMGYAQNRMLFYKNTGEISQEVWDVLLYQILTSDANVQNQFYQAHINGDYQTKQAIHDHYFPQTSVALNNHVNTFLKDLDNLQKKGVGKDVNEHPRLPLIMQHNEFVKQTFLAVQAQLAQY